MLNELKNEWKNAIEAELRNYLGQEEIPELSVGVPPKSDMGDAAFPMFPYAKMAAKAPALIARDVMASLSAKAHPEGEMLVAGPYLNIRFDIPSLSGKILGEAEEKGDSYGMVDDLSGKKIRKVLCLLLVCTIVENRPAAEGGVRRADYSGRCTDSGQLLYSDSVGDVVSACSAVFSWERNTHKSVFCHLFYGFGRKSVFLVDVCSYRFNFVSSKLSYHFSYEFLFLRQLKVHVYASLNYYNGSHILASNLNRF